MSDHLGQGQNEAIGLLLSLPEDQPDAELHIGGITDPLVWLGMGWLVGKGWAVYRGDDHFRFAKGQRDHAKSWLEN